MDVAPIEYPVHQAVAMDLRYKASIDRAVDLVGGPVHAVFAAAGVADGPDVMRVNFTGHRHLVQRMLAGGHLPRAPRSVSSRR